MGKEKQEIVLGMLNTSDLCTDEMEAVYKCHAESLIQITLRKVGVIWTTDSVLVDEEVP